MIGEKQTHEKQIIKPSVAIEEKEITNSKTVSMQNWNNVESFQLI